MHFKLKKKKIFVWAKRITLIAIVLSISGCIDICEIELKNIHRVKTIDANKVEKIEIFSSRSQYENQNNKLIKMLEDRADINGFIECLRTIEAVNPSHPQYPNIWYVNIVVDGAENEELKLKQRIGDKSHLYVTCLGHSFLGSAADTASSDLYKWMETSIGLPEL